MRAFRLEKHSTIRSISLIGSLAMLVCGAVSCNNGVGKLNAAPQETSVGSAETESSKAIPEWFAMANKSFVAGNFREARVWYDKVAARCVGTELCVQCEYFAAISAWNADPNEASASLIETWLNTSKAYEQRVSKDGGRIASPSWSHWVQSAQIVLSQWEASQSRFDAAKKYLDQAIEESERSGNGGPRVRYELGRLYAKFLGDPVTAVIHLDRALAEVGSDRSLKNKSLLTKALALVDLKDIAGADSCLQLIQGEELTPEQCVEAKLVEFRILAANGSEEVKKASSELYWAEAIKASTGKQVPPSLLAELAAALRDANLESQSNIIVSELIGSYPTHTLSIEARIHQAYRAASQSEWQRVQDLTLAVIDIGSTGPWSTYAMYLNARSKMELGTVSEGVALLDSLLQDPDVSAELKTNIHLDLAQTHYISETWDKLEAHVEHLSQCETKSELPAPQIPRVRMWKAELLAHKGSWDDAEIIVSAIRNDFPEWNRRAEVDYLLSRCLIARAEFDSARTILLAIVEHAKSEVGLNPGRPSTLGARSAWMIGETFMMQQRYEEASHAYGQVLQFPTESFWCAASIAQRGLCAEQLNRVQEAKEHYEKVMADFPESPFAQNARTRLSGLSLSTKQVERIGSGTKR